MDQISEFVEKMAAQDLDPGDIVPDAVVHRFPTWGDKSGEASGAYWHNGNVGWFQDWRTMDKAHVVEGTLSEADKEALAGSFNGNGQKVSRKALEAGIRKIYHAGTDPDDHPYLSKKQIPAVPQVKQYDGKLIIPVFGIDGKLNGLQRIDADGRKRFLTGTRKKGSFFDIVGSKTVVICEGFGTGVSIHHATGFSITVAFDAGNLKPVAEKICKKVGSDKAIIAGDRDSWKIAEGKPDTGTQLAKKAASSTGARLVLPVFQKTDGKHTTDFNDLFIAEGVDAVKAQLKAAKPGEGDFDNLEPVDIFGDTFLTGKPAWPDDACPKVLEDFAKDTAGRIGVEIAMVAFPAIICAAIATSDKFKIQPKEHDTLWTESARLWGAIIAEPGQKKTPALKAVTAPLKEIEKKYYFQFQEDMAEYQRKKEIYDNAKKDAIKKGGGLDIEEPEKPIHKRIMADDITIEALRQVLKDNDHGVACVKDELSGWIAGFDIYRSSKSASKDRADYCELYQGGEKFFDRAGTGYTFVPNWSASILGGIQPGPVTRMMGQITDDGLLARFLVCRCEKKGHGEDKQPNFPVVNTYNETIKQLSKLRPKDGDEEIFLFSDTAIIYRKIISNICNDVMLLPDTSDALKGHLNKWESTFSRIALSYHIVEATAAGEYPTRYITKDTVEMAAKLMTEFLLPNSIRFYRETLDDESQGSHTKWVAGYILANNLEEISKRNIMMDYGKLRQKSGGIQKTMGTLYQNGWVEPNKTKKNGETISWTVNPKVHAKFAKRAGKEKIRRDKKRQKIQQAVEKLKVINGITG